MSLTTTEIIHDQKRSLFYLKTDNGPAYVEYRRSGDEMELTRTFTPMPERGKGIAARVTRQVLNYARENELKVDPVCPYIRVYIERNPEYKEIAVR